MNMQMQQSMQPMQSQQSYPFSNANSSSSQSNFQQTSGMNSAFINFPQPNAPMHMNHAQTASISSSGSHPNKKALVQELSQLVDGVGSESTESDSDDLHNPHALNNNGKRMQAQQQPSFGSNNNRKSIVYTKEMSAPKFNAARASRKRSNDRTDFAMDDDDVKSIEREGVTIDENGYALNAIDANVENATNIRSSSED